MRETNKQSRALKENQDLLTKLKQVDAELKVDKTSYLQTKFKKQHETNQKLQTIMDGLINDDEEIGLIRTEIENIQARQAHEAQLISVKVEK